MARRNEERGYLLPETLNPDQVSICICVPCDTNHALAFLGQLKALGDWWTWERDAAKRGKDAAHVWRAIYEDVDRQLNECGVFDMANPCGCGHEGRMSRISDTGVYQISDDGGLTWEDAPDLDPRNTSTVFPPLPGGIGDTTRCAAAENAAAQLENFIIDVSNKISAGAAFLTFATAVIAIVAIWFSGGALAALVLPFASAAFALGAAGLSAAFDSTAYEAFKCCVATTIDTDGSYSDISGLLACVNEDMSGSSRDITVLIVQMMGPVGITNWARTGSGTGDTCECGDCAATATYVIWQYDAGPDVEPSWWTRTGGTVADTSVDFGPPYATSEIILQADHEVEICFFETFNSITPSPGGNARVHIHINGLDYTNPAAGGGTIMPALPLLTDTVRLTISGEAGKGANLHWFKVWYNEP